MAAIEFQNISKRFPGVLALDGVSFRIEPGTCHALIGENGAGKSTLGRILAGIHKADEGTILLVGKAISPTNPLEARQLGVAMVHQESAFCPNLSVAENLSLGAMPSKNGFVDRARMKADALRMLEEIEAEIDPERPISELSTGQEQVVQIAAAVGTGARVIVMDEPTSSLSSHESEHLFNLIGKLKERGITLIYVSHRMDEVFQLCEGITVLRDGRAIWTGRIAETTPNRVVEQMVGRELRVKLPQHALKDCGAELLRVENLSSPGKFSGINFSVRAGEVLGFAGLVGAGRSEVAQAIFGLDPEATGRVWVAGNEIPLGKIATMLAAGVGLVPEDRKKLGLVLSMNCRENASLAMLPELTSIGFLQLNREQALVREHTEPLGVKAPSMEAPIAGLSGGNQQKIALAKWLARRCKVLIVDEPTRGIDVGAKAEVHEILDRLACEGTAVIVISSDLPEVMGVSRRIVVMREGRIQGELGREQFSEQGLVRMMAGLEKAAA